MSLLWRVAREALMRAERLVVWGYSCPTTDYHVAWLLRGARSLAGEGRLREVHVIDPDCQRVKSRLQLLMGPGPTFQTFAEHDAYQGDSSSA